MSWFLSPTVSFNIFWHGQGKWIHYNIKETVFHISYSKNLQNIILVKIIHVFYGYCLTAYINDLYAQQWNFQVSVLHTSLGSSSISVNSYMVFLNTKEKYYLMNEAQSKSKVSLLIILCMSICDKCEVYYFSTWSPLFTTRIV